LASPEQFAQNVGEIFRFVAWSTHLLALLRESTIELSEGFKDQVRDGMND